MLACVRVCVCVCAFAHVYTECAYSYIGACREDGQRPSQPLSLPCLQNKRQQVDGGSYRCVWVWVCLFFCVYMCARVTRVNKRLRFDRAVRVIRVNMVIRVISVGAWFCGHTLPSLP